MADNQDLGLPTKSPESCHECAFDSSNECVCGEDKLSLKLKELGRTWAQELLGFECGTHPAINNCFIDSLAAHYQDPEITPVTIYTKISEEARKMAKYYGVFLPNGKRDLESMISRFEDEGDYEELYSHLPAVIRIAENALEKEIIVLNDEGEIKSFGKDEKKITNETIVIVDYGLEFRGTHVA
ncbi:uncharacterized protein [Watersipora subatra]|uniref:uncharacterized protein isoform X1 n=1 Tax=Watersipora subatra TaxID=2589382 RepID=UPI00355C2FCE